MSDLGQAPAEAGSDASVPNYDPWVVRAVIASQFGPPFMFSAVAVVLPDMGRRFGAGATELGLVETLFLSSSLSFLLPMGRLADDRDKRAVFKWGLLAFALICLAIAWAPNMLTVLGLRLMQGVASAAVSGTGSAVLADLVPKARRGKAFGASIGSIYAGLTLGPMVAGALVSRWSYHAVFLAGGVVVMMGALLVLYRLPSTWPRDGKPLHLKGTTSLVTALLCWVFATTMTRTPMVAIALGLCGLLTMAHFLRTLQKHPRALIRIELLTTNPTLARALLIQGLLYVNAFTTVFVLSLLLQVSLSIAPDRAGQLLAISAVCMTLLAPVSGALSDRVGPARIATVGVACLLCSSALGSQFDQETGLLYVGAMLALQGLGFGLFSSPNTAIVMGAVTPDALSVASALGAKARSMGMMVGMLFATGLLAYGFGTSAPSTDPALLASLASKAFTFLCAVTAISLVLSMRRSRPTSSHSAPTTTGGEAS